MPRKPFYPNPNSNYHISARAINKEWFVDLHDSWRLFVDYTNFLVIGFDAEISAFVMMANHFHMLARFPKGNISEAMEYFMRETSKSMTKHSGRINRLWGSRYYRSEISTSHYYDHVYKYIYRNPVEACITDRAERYPYSTLCGLVGFAPLHIQLTPDEKIASDTEATLAWLNRAPRPGDREAIKKGIMKPIFKLPIGRQNRSRHPLEVDAY